MKNVLWKMSGGIRAVYAIKRSFPIHAKTKVKNSVFVSHFQNSAVLLSGMKGSLLFSLEKQLK